LAHIRDEIEGLFSRYGSDTSHVTSTVKMLSSYLMSRSQTTSFLISGGYCWDAEIILRAFYEAAAKVLFICFAEDNEKSSLADEYWHGFRPISDRRTGRKAAFAEQLFEKESVSALVFNALQDKQLFELDSGPSPAERKRLEQKWSFSEIIETLERYALQGKPTKQIKSLLHIYGMASHLIHADHAAMELIVDRATRVPEERGIVQTAHAARMMTDQVALAWLCADAIRQHFHGQFIDAMALKTAYEETMRLSKPLQAAFEESQREFYARWGHTPD
jgi:hypothetical protein